MARKEIVHDIRQKPAETAQTNGAPLSDGLADGGAPSQMERVKDRGSRPWPPRSRWKSTGKSGMNGPHPHIDVSYEWNNGILEAKPLPNFAQTEQYRWFFRLLCCYLEVNPSQRYYAWKPAPTCRFEMKVCLRGSGKWYSSLTSASSWTTIRRLGERMINAPTTGSAT